MDNRFEQTLLKKRYTSGFSEHQKILDITKYQTNAN